MSTEYTPPLADISFVLDHICGLNEINKFAVFTHADREVVTDLLSEAVGASLQALTKLKGAVELVGPGSLPNDGKVIADERTYG